jgi:hypothetical protein
VRILAPIALGELKDFLKDQTGFHGSDSRHVSAPRSCRLTQRPE